MKDRAETPADAFDRYLAEIEPTLPERYRRVRACRPLNPYRIPPIGLAIVALGLVGYAVATVFGWT